jgi:hypothetical protein
MKILCG